MKLSVTLFLTITLAMSPFAGFSPRCSSYFVWICNQDKKPVRPEEQVPIDTQHRASYWPRQLGLSERPRWIRYRVSKVVPPDDPKQQSPGPTQKVFSLHDILGHVRDNLVQTHVPCVLMDVLKHMCILILLRIFCGLWRNIRRLRGQVSN